jgi:hypothetical protein
MISMKKDDQFQKGLSRKLRRCNGIKSSLMISEKKECPCQQTTIGKSHKVCIKSSESRRGVESDTLLASSPRTISTYIPVLYFTADINIPAT